MSIWGTAKRPATPSEGMFGYNAETNKLEIYDGYDWYSIDSTIV